MRKKPFPRRNASREGRKRLSRTRSCAPGHPRSEEHTSELQSRFDLGCRPCLLLFPYTTLFRSRFFCVGVGVCAWWVLSPPPFFLFGWVCEHVKNSLMG